MYMAKIDLVTGSEAVYEMDFKATIIRCGSVTIDGP